MTRRSKDALALVTIAVLVAIAFADVLFLSRAFFARDVSRFYRPMFVILHDFIRAGAFPFWSELLNGGQPFAANPAYAALYPPQWLFTSLDVEAVAHYLWAAIGMYLFLRSLGLRIGASLFGAVSFALGGMMLSLSNLLTAMFGFAWFPWLALTVRRRHYLLAALVLGIILMLGDQNSILQAGFLLVAYFLWRREWKPAALVFACALLVGSVQIVPALDHQFDSGRAAPIGYRMATTWSLPPARILELALPSLFGTFRDATYYWAGKRFYGEAGAVPWVFSFYNGLLVFVLACAGFVRRTRGYKFAATYAVFSFVMATTPLPWLLSGKTVRYPEKFFISGVFVLIVFASMVFDQLPELRGTAAVVAGIVAIAAAGSLLIPIASTWHLSGYVADYVREARVGAVVTIVTAAVLAILLAVRRVPLAVLALFVAADLGPRVEGLKPTVDKSFYDPPPIAQGLRGARVYNDADWRFMLTATPPIPSELYVLRAHNAMLPEMPALWGIASLLAVDVTVTDLKPTIDFRNRFWGALITNNGPVVQQSLRAAGTTFVADLRDATDVVNPIRLVRLNHPRYYFDGGTGRVVSASERPNSVDLDVETQTSAPLFIAITRHKYWKGTLDGTPAALQPSNIAFQSMTIPPGRHRVALRYRNPLVEIFGVVSLLSAIALLAAHFVTENRRGRGDVERSDAA